MDTIQSASSVISSDKVHGTNVFNPNGEKLGSIESLVLDKLSGKVRYAVMEFGGFLGMGTDVYPLPWETLKYDTNLGGYVVTLTREQLGPLVGLNILPGVERVVRIAAPAGLPAGPLTGQLRTRFTTLR